MEYLPVIIILAFIVGVFVIFEAKRRLGTQGGIEQVKAWFEKEKANLPLEYRFEMNNLIKQVTGESDEKSLSHATSCCSSSDSPTDRALERLYYMMKAAPERKRYEEVKQRLGLDVERAEITRLEENDIRVVYVDKLNEEMFLVGKLDDNTFVARDKDDKLHDLIEEEFRIPPRLEGGGYRCSCASMAEQGNIKPEQYITIRPKLVNEKSLDEMFLIRGKTLDGRFVAEDSKGRMFKLKKLKKNHSENRQSLSA